MPFEEKLKTGEPLTNFETYQVIQYLINQSRIENNVKDEGLMKCEDCNMWISQNLIYNSYYCNVDVIDTTFFEFNPNFKHVFSIISLNTEKGPKSFLIDPVFEQFDTNNYPISGKEYNSKEAFENQIFFNQMKEQRYFELTDKNINNYISGLVTFNNMSGGNLKIETILQLFKERINNNKMIISNYNNLLINEKEILIQLRTRLIQVLKERSNQPDGNDSIKIR